jgi:hypothetical protein
MANRCYLYTTDHLPGSAAWQEKKPLRGIAEWNDHIPLTFQILLSGNPVAVRSSIWDSPHPIAIAGDAATGLRRLMDYLQLLPPQAEPLVADTKAFFEDPENHKKHFVLEIREIFDYADREMAEKNAEIIAQIAAIGDELSSLYLPEPATAEPFLRRTLRRLLRLPPPSPLEPYDEIGLGLWSNILYYDFSPEQEQAPQTIMRAVAPKFD